MSMAAVVCPRCSCPTAPGRFCEHCGERLPGGGAGGDATPERQADSGKAAASAENPEIRRPDIPELRNPETPELRNPELPAIPETPPLETPAAPPLPPLSPLPSIPPLPSLSPLPSFGAPATPPAARPASLVALEFSAPDRLREGMKAVLLFHVRIAPPDAGSFQLSVEGLGSEPASLRKRCGDGLADEDIPLNVRPSEAGCIAATVRLEIFRAESSEPEVWESPLLLAVAPSAAHASPFTINIHNEGDLAEISLDALAGLSEGGGGDPLRALDNPRRFAPVAGLRLVSSPTRLTLRFGGRRLHLVARTPAWFGRQSERPEKGRTRDNAIALRCATADGSLDASSTCYLSRTCFLVERDGDRCRVREGAPARDEKGNVLPGGVISPSGCGVAVDGERLPPRGAISLAAGEEHAVSAAPGAPGGGLALHLLALPAADAPSACSGALLRRADALPESYLVLWAEADCGEFEPALAGWRVRCDGAAFALRRPDGALLPLVPGTVFGPRDHAVSTHAFQQILP